MAHAAIADGATHYGPKHYAVRGITVRRLLDGSRPRTLMDEERVKALTSGCRICGADERLTLDHLVPTFRGGEDEPANAVWLCRSCNSSKRDRDLLLWLAAKGELPPVLLLRHYLKLFWKELEKRGELETEWVHVDAFPFEFGGLPRRALLLNQVRL